MKRSTLNIIILTMAVINFVLNLLIIFSVIPNVNRTNEMITKIASLVDLDLSIYTADGGGAVSVDDLETIAIRAGEETKMTINLKSADGKSHFAVITAYITVNKQSDDYKKKRESVDNAMPLIASSLSSVVSQYDEIQAKDSNIQNEMREEVLREIKELFRSDMIYSVVFESIIIQ